jgi:hypothetical protein
MCLACGFYKGRVVIDLKAKKEAREARINAKREAINAQLSQFNESVAPAEKASAETK